MNDIKKRFKKYLYFGLVFSILGLLWGRHNLLAVLPIFAIIIVFFVLCEIILMLYYKNNIPSEEENPIMLPFSLGPSKHGFMYNCSVCGIQNIDSIIPSKIEKVNYFVCKDCKTTNEISDSFLKEDILKNEKEKKIKEYGIDKYDRFCSSCNFVSTLDEIEISQKEFVCPNCNKLNLI